MLLFRLFCTVQLTMGAIVSELYAVSVTGVGGPVKLSPETAIVAPSDSSTGEIQGMSFAKDRGCACVCADSFVTIYC